MSFTPTAGLVMGTRCGDLDPGFIPYLLRTERPTADELDALLNRQSGMLGISGGGGGDMRDLDGPAGGGRTRPSWPWRCSAPRPSGTVGAFAAELGGVDAIVFAGGIGEHSPEARAGICAGLSFLGVEIDPAANGRGADVISTGPRGRAGDRHG